MMHVNYSEIVKFPFSVGAMIRSDYPGYEKDYLLLHCLIRCYHPRTFMEIGTSSGLGTNVICHALGVRPWQNKSHFPRAYSIDVPPGTDPTIIYPEKEDGHPALTGEHAYLPFTQIFGNSLNFDFTPYYPLEGWFIDGKHNYEFACNDTLLALRANPKILIWHDADIEEVARAIEEVMASRPEYKTFRIPESRIAFAVKKEKFCETSCLSISDYFSEIVSGGISKAIQSYRKWTH